jgi:hypothetical protein
MSVGTFGNVGGCCRIRMKESSYEKCGYLPRYRRWRFALNGGQRGTALGELSMLPENGGEGISRCMAEHVGMNREWQLGGHAKSFNQLLGADSAWPCVR